MSDPLYRPDAMQVFRDIFAPNKWSPNRPKKEPGMTDREFRLSIRKAHMMSASRLLCGADNKTSKGALPFLVTRNWEKVTCGKCLSLRK